MDIEKAEKALQERIYNPDNVNQALFININIVIQE